MKNHYGIKKSYATDYMSVKLLKPKDVSVWSKTSEEKDLLIRCKKRYKSELKHESHK